MFQVFRVFQVFHFAFGPKNWSKSEQNRVFQAFQVFHAFQGRNPNQARSATNQASLRAANQVRNTANPYLQMKLFYEKVGFYEIFV